jgi:serine/threonine protein kinase
MKVCNACKGHFGDELEVCPSDNFPLVLKTKKDLIGEVIGDRYKIIQVVGSGSMGVVYKALQLSTGREVAVKVINDVQTEGSSGHQRFLREAKVVSAIKHENIVQLYDFGEMNDNQPYIVTEFIQGKTLAALIKERGRLTISEVLPIFHQVCNAVDEAHRAKVIHRDLKPENIILQEPEPGKSKPQGLRAKVVDFGVAKSATDASYASLTVEGRVCGSPGYMSPEQCKALPVDGKSDIYSLGIILFEMLSGRRPFSADSVMALLLMHVNDQPPLMAAACLELNLSSAVEEVVRKALSKDPSDRQESASQLWQEFSEACSGKASKTVQSKSTHNDWIPFDGQENAIFIEGARQFTSTIAPDSLAALAASVEQLDRQNEKSKPAGWFSKPILFSLFAAASIIAVMAYINIFPSQIHLNNPQAEPVNTLIAQNKLTEAVATIDRIQKHNKLNNSDFEMLNRLYLEVASKYSQKKNYANAIQTIEHIPVRSKHYNEAHKLAKHWRRLLSE